MKPHTFIYCFCLSILAVTLPGSAPRWTRIANAQTTAANRETVIPLEGLDPVLLAQGKEVQGDMKFTVTRGQFQYMFPSAESKATFEKDPARYEIQLDGHCARMGSPTHGDPDLYTVHNGRIYIFGSEECQTAFKAAPEKYLEVPAPPKITPTGEMVKRGQQLIAKAAEAIGGSKLDQLTSFQRKDARGPDVKTTLLLAFPDALRLETVRPNFTLVSVVSPSDSFFVANTRTSAMPEDNRAALWNQLNHELIVLLRARTRPDFKVASNGKTDAGQEFVEVELPNFTTTLGVDPATGRVLSQTYHGRGPGGVLGEIAINYSDFRNVDGLSLPFKMAATFDGQPFPTLSATVEATTINGQIDASSFQKPKS
jgi:YHS domain-containing protein